MMPRRNEFKLEEERDEEIKKFASESNACLLAIIAPFAPERVAPRRVVFAEFRYPEEFMIEEFTEIVAEKFPEKEKRPPLYLLIHSPGGAISSAYVIASVLRENFSNITAFVPHIAASGATLLAIASNEIVMGDISQLSPIDPYYIEGDRVIYAISLIRAFQTLDEYFKTRGVEEASYPYQRFADCIFPEAYDRAVRLVEMVGGYANELLEKAGYSEQERDGIIQELLYQASLHQETIRFSKAKEIGIKVKHWKEKKENAQAWLVMKRWLKKYYLQPSPIHIIRYTLP